MTTWQRSRATWSRWIPMLRVAGLAATAAVLTARLPFFVQAGVGTSAVSLLVQASTLGVVLLATGLNRTAGPRTMLSAWLWGAFPVMALALATGLPVAAWLGTDGAFLGSVWVPFTEEVVKALPVLAWFTIAARRGSWQPSATDGLLLGFLVGAGFDFHEDVMATRPTGSGWGAALPWTALAPMITVIKGSPQGDWIVSGHAAWTALVGLAIGLAFVHRNRRWCRALPLVALAVVTLDHASHNHLAWLRRDEASVVLRGLRVILLDGWLPLVGLACGLVVAVALERRMLRWSAERDPVFPDLPARARWAQAWARRWRGLAPLLAGSAYVRARRAAHLAAYRWPSRPVSRRVARRMMTRLHRLGRAADLREHGLGASPADGGAGC